jgi:hypothetical protein
MVALWPKEGLAVCYHGAASWSSLEYREQGLQLPCLSFYERQNSGVIEGFSRSQCPPKFRSVEAICAHDKLAHKLQQNAQAFT